jgi:SAM-dependent methyltransferase
MSERNLHEEIRAAWEIVATAKYHGELDDHVEFLRSGGHTLLRPELELLADLLPSCRRVIVLQCSHGLDALGLLNLGVREVVGVDISEEMIRQAERKTAALDAAARFHRADVLEAPVELNGTADLIYTGKGSLPWIIDLDAWAATVERLLMPGGRIFIFEGHPLDALWDHEAERFQIDERSAGYFAEEPRESSGFPASLLRRVAAGKRAPRLMERFWRPGQVIDRLLRVGLRLEAFDEHPEIYWNQFPNIPEPTLRLLPHSYSALAQKSGEV